MWPRGTRRLLGVLSREGEAESDKILPKNVLKMGPSFERSLWGRFRVCPLTPERRGWMRMVYLDAATNLLAVPY